MIFLHNNKNKIYLTFFLALVTFIGIVVAWQKVNVFSIAVSQPEIKNEEPGPKSIVKDLQNELELTKLEWDDAQKELDKKKQQEALLQATKEYLKNKSTSTATSTAATNVK